MEELANEDAQKDMAFWSERAVDEQKRELRGSIRKRQKRMQWVCF
jgi:hypothetical protein